jgi:hypothetical protein
MLLWRINGPTVLPAGSYVCILAALLAATGFLLSRFFGSPLRLHLPAWSCGLFFVFLSDWLCRNYSYFQAPSVRGEIFLLSLLGLFLLRRNTLSFFCWWLVAAAVVLFWSLLVESGGAVIFSDDHASVFYRLFLLQKHFPAIPMYNPMWNAGYDARDFFSTGILNLYFLSWPLLKFFALEQVYNIIIGGVLFVLLPLSLWFASRLLGADRLAAALSAILSLTTSLVWYRWSLKYGSMGFVTSTALLPLVVASGLRVLDERHNLRGIEAVGFVLIFTLMLFWSLTAVAVLPMFVPALLHLKPLLRGRFRKGIVLALLLINLPWIVVWLKVANVFHFVMHPAAGAPSIAAESDAGSVREDSGTETVVSPAKEHRKHDRRRGARGTHTIQRDKILDLLRNFTVNANVVLLFFGIPGILLLDRFRSRTVWCLLAGWLLLLSTIISQLKPQLELERMLVVLSVLLCVPAGRALRKFFVDVAGDGGVGRLPFFSGRNLEQGTRRIVVNGLAALTSGFVLAGPLCAVGIVRNRSLEVYSFADATVSDMSDAIRRFGGSGRTVYSGFVLHELDHGHLAPLAYYTGRPLVASSPVHNTWWYTDVIPDYYRDAGAEGVERFLDLMNATSVMAHEPFWREYFASRPAKYRLVWEGGRFKMFVRTAYNDGYFLQGSGEIVEQKTDGVRLRVDSGSAVIKFNYLPFLRASACTLSPASQPGGIEFIRLSDCPVGQIVDISAQSGFSRVFR